MLELLSKYGDIGIQMLQGLIPKVTGKTAASLHKDVTKDRLIIWGRPFFRALETGRSPRVKTQQGDFKQNLDEWLRAKGFETKKSKSGIVYYKIGTQWFSAKSLAWKINKTGDKTFRQGGKDVYFSQLEKFIEELNAEVKKELTKKYTDFFYKQTKEAIGSVST